MILSNMDICLKDKYFMKKVIWLLLVIVGGCVSKPVQTDYPVIDVEDLLANPEELFVSDVAIDMKVIQLETSDSCLIGRGLFFDLRDEGIVFHDGGLKKFNVDGSFEGNVFRRGQGPSEIPGMMDYFLKDSLIYLTTLSKVCQIYTYHGGLKEEFPIPVHTNNGFAVLDDNKFVTAMLGWGEQNKKGRLLFFDKDTILNILYKPYSIEGAFPESYMMGKEADFISYNDTVYMKEVLNDTIFSIDPSRDTIKPYLVYDFGKYKSKPEFRYNIPLEELYMKVPYTIFLGMSEKYVYLTTMFADMQKKESIDALCIYDKESQKCRIVRLAYSGKDIDKLKSILKDNFDETKSPYFVPISLSESGDYLCALLPQITEQNPSIVLIKLR